MAQAARIGNEAEHQQLEKLRDHYTKLGYQFIAHPSKDQIPDFLGSYKPDAIVLGRDRKYVIEVKQSRGRDVEPTLQYIKNLFEGQPDWSFIVSYGGADPYATDSIPVASIEAIRARLKDVATLASQGQNQAAFVLAWSLVEAALRAVDGSIDGRPRKPGTLVERLSMLGLVSPEAENKLRQLIKVRNSIVHGDVAVEPESSDIRVITDVTAQILSPSST